MKFRDDVYLGFTSVANVLAIYFALVIAPAEEQMGDLIRILYFHLPAALTMYTTLILSALSALTYLVKKNHKFDAFSVSTAQIGLVYGVITLIGGSIWAKATWGVYWHMDPRETTTLILWLAYAGYFILRLSVKNVERRAYVSAVYNILAVLTVPISYVSLILWPSIHPRLIASGWLGLTGAMVQGLILNTFSGLLFTGWLVRKAYTIQLKTNPLESI